MTEINQYLEELHNDIQREYNTDSNGDFRNCVTIAFDVADVLKKQNDNIYFIQLRTNNEALKPKLLPGNEWSSHVAACVGTKVYDPLHQEPVELKEYIKLTFEGEKIYGLILSDKENFYKNHVYYLEK